MKYFPSILFILLFLASCGSSGQQNNGSDQCETKPSAIFSDTMAIVKGHNFEAKAENSTEEVILKNDVRIEILQSGCEVLRQEFRITRKGDFMKMEDSFWISGAFQTLGQLSDSSPALKGLESFANVIAQNLPKMKLAQPFYPEPEYSITVDKIANAEAGTIIVIIEGNG